MQRSNFVHAGSGEVANLSEIKLDAASEKLLQQGQEAWQALKGGITWEKWKAIGFALDMGQTEVMKVCRTNQPVGALFSRVMSEWLTVNGFHEIDKAVRHRLIKCIDHLIEIEEWRATLALSERLRYNHPSTIWRKFEAATAKSHSEEKESKPNSKNEEIRRLQEESDAKDKLIRDLEDANGSDPDKIAELERQLEEWKTRALAAEKERDDLRNFMNALTTKKPAKPKPSRKKAQPPVAASA